MFSAKVIYHDWNMSLCVTLIGLPACMLVGQYFPEVADSTLKFPLYASKVYVLS